MTYEESIHKVLLSGNEISTILFILEGYNSLDSNGYDPECREDVDNILEKLEEVADNWKGQFAEPKVIDSLTHRFGSMEQIELKEYIIEMEHKCDNLDAGQELYDELVDNATQQYAKLPNTFGGQS